MLDVQLSVPTGVAYTIVAPQTPASLFCAMLPGQAITGSSVSFTVTVNEQVEVLPLASVTVNVFTVTPTGNNEPDTKPAV